MISRRALVAAMLTIVAPGMGQLYLGLPLRALAIWLVGLALTAMSFVGILTPAFRPFVAWVLLLVPIAFILWAAWDALRRADTAPAPTAWYQRWYIFVLVALAIGLALQPFVYSGQRRIVDAFRVPSGSMESGFLIGDYLYADTRTSARVGVTRGSPVIHRSPEEPGLKQLKRVVAVGGDTVGMRAGRLTVNGVPADEPYVTSLAAMHGADPDQRAAMLKWQEPLLTQRDSVSLHPDLNDWGPLVLPHETLLVLGDNRQASYDSRFWGPLPQRMVLGRPAMIYYSWAADSGRFLPFLTAIRWSRLGTRPE